MNKQETPMTKEQKERQEYLEELNRVIGLAIVAFQRWLDANFQHQITMLWGATIPDEVEHALFHPVYKCERRYSMLAETGQIQITARRVFEDMKAAFLRAWRQYHKGTP